MSQTLRARVASGSAVLLTVVLTVLGLASYRLLSRWLEADATMRLTELSEGLRGYLRFGGGAAPRVVFNPRDPEVAAFIHEATQYYQIYDLATGSPIIDSEGARSLGLEFTPDRIRALGDDQRPIDVATPLGRIRIANTIVNRGGHTYLLQVGVSLARIDAALRRYRTLLSWGLPLAIVLVAFAARIVAGAALSPLVRVAEVARSIDVRNLGTRLPTRGTDDELDRVVLAFNETLDRLENAIGEMRQFSAALAHELRTPLAILRGEIELGLRQADSDPQTRLRLANQLEAIDRLKRLIDQILTLARAESGQIALTMAPVDVGELAGSLVEQLQPVAETRGIQLSCEQPDRVMVEGDGGWLERLLLNLLDNAMKFTAAGGRVEVDVSRNGTRATIIVSDTGIGMSSEDAERAFERFFRADRARSSSTEGAGLGLSLAQWIAQSHHGAITIDSRRGTGSIFTITLPAASR